MGIYTSVYVGITLSVKNRATTINVTKRVHPETGKEFNKTVQFCPTTGVKLTDVIEQKWSVERFDYYGQFGDDNLVSPPYPEFNDRAVFLVNAEGTYNDDNTFLFNLTEFNIELEIFKFCHGKYGNVLNYLTQNGWEFEVNYSVFHYAS